MSGIIIRWRSVAKACVATLLVLLLIFSPWGGDRTAIAARRKSAPKPASVQASKLSEVAPPPVLLELREVMDAYQPQVKILSPRSDEVVPDNTVSVRFQVNDLPLFKDESLGLGPHLHVFLDNQPYQAVYDTSQPLIFENLSPGTHTIRAFASRPWHESFKNEGAYAQTTFHILTKTQEYSPASEQPLLTYSRPQGNYGAEPIMLDFYLTNAPLHLIAQKDSQDDIPDWRIRCTVNGYSFILDQWQPVYLKGFKPGKNWVQLEFIDENGNVVNNVFNNTARLITYEPNGTDTLSKLVQGELSLVASRGIVDPNYQPPVEELPAPREEPAPELTPTPEASPTVEPMPVPEPPASEPGLETPEPAIDSLEEMPAPPSAETLAPVEVPAVPDIAAPAEPTPVPIVPEPISAPSAAAETPIENAVEPESPAAEGGSAEPLIAPGSEELELPPANNLAPEPIVPEPTPIPEPLPPIESVQAPELQEAPIPTELSAPIEETPVLLVPAPVETSVVQPVPSVPTASQEITTPEEPIAPIAPIPASQPTPSATSQVGQQVGKVGRQLGEQAGQLGQKASQFRQKASQQFGQWFDRARRSVSTPAAPSVSPSPATTEPGIGLDAGLPEGE